MNIIKILRDIQTMKMLLKTTILTPTIKAYIMHMEKNVLNLSSSETSGTSGDSDQNKNNTKDFKIKNHDHNGHVHSSECNK